MSSGKETSSPAQAVKEQPRGAAVEARAGIRSQAEQLATGEGDVGMGRPAGDVNVPEEMTSREDVELEEAGLEREEKQS